MLVLASAYHFTQEPSEVWNETGLILQFAHSQRLRVNEHGPSLHVMASDVAQQDN